MSRRLQAVLFLAGVMVVAFLVMRSGPARILEDVRSVGWIFLPVLALFGLIEATSAVAWRLTLHGIAPRPSFLRLCSLTVSGFALNSATPFINAGGEPFKVTALAQWTGMRRATASVVLHKLLHTSALVLTWIAAVALALLTYDAGTRLRVAAVAVLLALVGLGTALFLGHRNGVLEWLLDLALRIPVLRRFAARLEPRRGTLVELDSQIAAFYTQSPGRFWLALGFEFLSRCLWMAEYWLIGIGLGIQLSFTEAFVIGGLSSLALNLLFFIPYEAGSKEGVNYLLFDFLHFDPRLGLSMAIVSRLRDLAWIGTGFLLIWTARRTAPAERGTIPA